MSVVDIRNLEITFATDGGDVAAVQDVSLSAAAGEVLAIVGESGSGKTVTAKSIIGLLPESALTRGSSCSTAATWSDSPARSCARRAARMPRWCSRSRRRP